MAIDPEPYITVYGGTGAPPFSHHANGGNGTAYMPRHGYENHDCAQFARYGMAEPACESYPQG